MKIRVCDRCRREIKTIDLSLTDDDFKDGAWRYTVIQDCHPYPEKIEIDLCLNCKKELAKWLKGEQK